MAVAISFDSCAFYASDELTRLCWQMAMWTLEELIVCEVLFCHSCSCTGLDGGVISLSLGLDYVFFWRGPALFGKCGGTGTPGDLLILS